jgi:hypothetical protein
MAFPARPSHGVNMLEPTWGATTGSRRSPDATSPARRCSYRAQTGRWHGGLLRIAAGTEGSGSDGLLSPWSSSRTSFSAS